MKANGMTDQVAAALEGFFWPKIFWDFLTKNFDGAVKPIPILQIINLVFGIIGLLWEWPLSLWGFPGSGLHKSMEARIVLYPLFALAAVMLYQATNPALYYMIGIGMYFWAYSEGEVSWTGPEMFELELTVLGHLREELDLAEETDSTDILQSLIYVLSGLSLVGICIARRWIPWTPFVSHLMTV